ncbi:polyphosphate kinase 2 family protein [Methylobacterium oryzihabitans]|uniref:Polyphosphate kinase 2 family protein n=1 Tax=Methylobacterium oryzihabitans TaxID=2499852 RepID=A0A437PDA1_9HYPH|nr:polyphosphate kinase 2 family protein [Methylobacterium oryzihabitans]RVU20204.1 polyphosphate kinase 2 family protein [Methylobacterium oryzihabitans]
MSKKHAKHKPDSAPLHRRPSSAAWADEVGRSAKGSPGALDAHGWPQVAAPPGVVVCRPGGLCDLAAIDPDGPASSDGKEAAIEALGRERVRIRDLQERLYAEHRRSLLVVLQAIDTGGKDGTIRSVFEGVNPQGCRVWSFKTPSQEELDHDFLWRYHHHVPGRGMIGVFNRSHYEDVLIVRVKDLVPEPVWRARYGLINDFERLLAHSGTVVLKFLLHISRDEQKERLESRLADPAKHWKFDPSDLVERRSWDAYQTAFQDALTECSTAHAPWYVVPANRKWFRNLVVARTIADTLEAMDPRFPEPAHDLSGITVPD